MNGRVVDEENQAVAYANILLLQATDSTAVNGTSTEEDGKFSFDRIAEGDYILKVSFLGYEALMNAIQVNSNLELGDLKISEDSEDLDEVNIVVKRPTLTKQPDRITFNVASTSLIEGNILQLLKSTPNLIVLDGDIRIKNTSAEVYINNRKVNLTSNELMQLLETAPANSIQSVEVISNPPASYDASSGAVINIIMSKNLIAGYRGSVYGQYEQGVFPRYQASTSHFFKGGKSNISLNYTYSKDKINRDNNDIVNYLNESNDVDEIWKSDINRNTWQDKHNLGFNYDLNFDDRNSLILTSSFLYTPYFKYKINNETTIFDRDSNLLSSFTANNLSRDDSYTGTADLDYIHKFKEKGQISISSNLTLYDYNRFQIVGTDFFDNAENLQTSSNFNTDNNQDTRIISSKVDYSIPLDDSSKFETGIKASFINTDSDITRTDIIGGSEIVNENNTDAFEYNENILSAYANYSKEWTDFSLNIGLRAEKTQLEGVSRVDDVLNDQDYTELFPNASFLYKFSDKFNLYTTYKRSIQRPSYISLNPFAFFLNENMVVIGNPRLQPILTDHATLGSTLFDFLTLEAYYKNIESDINELLRQDNQTNIIYSTPINIDNSIEYGFDAIVQFPWGDRIFVYAATSFFNINQQNTFDGEYSELDRWSNYSMLNTSLSLLKDYSLNLDFTLAYLSKSVATFAIVNERVYSSLSVSKSLLKGKAVVSLVASDILNMQDTKTRTKYLNQNSIYNSDIDNRTVALGFRYKFGNTKLESNDRSVKTEEAERIKKENSNIP